MVFDLFRHIHGSNTNAPLFSPGWIKRTADRLRGADRISHHFAPAGILCDQVRTISEGNPKRN